MSEKISSSETKGYAMCAETIKAKVIICRFCNHKYEPESNSVYLDTP